VASQWRDLGNGLWVTKWDRLFPSAPESWWQRLRSGKDTPLHRFNDDMVFIDGRFLQSAGFEGEVDESSFFNNLMVADATLNRPLLFVWQRSILCDRLRDPQFSTIDNNVYVKNGDRNGMPLILWSPAPEENCIAALGSPAEITARHPGFETMSLLMTDNIVFMSPELKNFRLLPAFTGNSTAANLPAEIKSLLKLKKNARPYVGAYPQAF
jgi:hypothetical protein